MNFPETLQSAGLIPSEIVSDGAWRRCPTEDHPRKRNGAYKLFPGGRLGLYRNWATHETVCQWKDDRPTDQATRMRVLRSRSDLAAVSIKATKMAAEHLQKCSPFQKVPLYLSRKGLGTLGTKGMMWDGGLIIPVVRHDGSLMSLQRIGEDGQKRFWPRAPIKGGAFTMSRRDAAVTCIVEGVATGLAIFQSIPSARVIVAFDAGNIPHVIASHKPRGSVVVCADNDHETAKRIGYNPGLRAAERAAEMIGCGVAAPMDIEGTDWADAIMEYGERAAKRIERSVLAQARYVSR